MYEKLTNTVCLPCLTVRSVKKKKAIDPVAFSLNVILLRAAFRKLTVDLYKVLFPWFPYVEC